MDQQIFKGKKIKIKFPALDKNLVLSDELRSILSYCSCDSFMKEEKNIYALRKYLCNVFGIEDYPKEIKYFNVEKMRNILTAIRILNHKYAPKAEVTLNAGSHVLVVDMTTGDIHFEYNVICPFLKGSIRDVITSKDGTQIEMVTNNAPGYITVFSLDSIEDL